MGTARANWACPFDGTTHADFDIDIGAAVGQDGAQDPAVTQAIAACPRGFEAGLPEGAEHARFDGVDVQAGQVCPRQI